MFSNIINMYSTEKNFDDKRLEALSICITSGIEIIHEIIKQKQKITNQDVIILSIYRKIIEQLDGLLSLSDIRSSSSATILLRSIFEISLGIQYIFQSEAKIEARALSYYVGYTHEELKVIKKFLKQKNYKLLSKEKLEKRLEEHNKTLNNERFREINKEWVKKRKQNQGYTPKWYSLFNGPKNLRALAEMLGQLDIYHDIYSIFSLETHGFSALKDLKKTEDGIRFLEFRSSEELSMQVSLSCTIFSVVTAKMVQVFLPEYKNEFSSFYDFIYSNLH